MQGNCKQWSMTLMPWNALVGAPPNVVVEMVAVILAFVVMNNSQYH